mgnify:CR=1 FL=1
MGLLDFLKGQLIDIIEWLDDTNYTLVWRFPDEDHEIKMGAKLVVREGQAAVFINEGKLADVYFPGTYTLSTQNMPILSSLRGWKYGFESPFKAEVYFVNTRQYLDQKWGTANPIMLRDKEFGPVRVRAFGVYAFRVTDPAMFMREVVGTDGHFTVEEIEGQVKRGLVSSFSTSLANSGTAVIDMAGQYPVVAAKVLEVMQPDFTSLGLRLTRFVIENISFPPDVEHLLDQRTGVGIMGDKIGAFAQMQAAQAMRDAASNPDGGAASAGIGLGAGMAMASMMANQFGQMGTPARATAPVVSPAAIPVLTAAPPVPAGRPCQACGHALAAGARFCPDCGAKQPTFCPTCRADVAGGAKFCSTCGTKVG